MTLQDPSTRLSYTRGRRRPLLGLLRRLRAVVPGRTPYGPGSLPSGRDRRQLTALDRSLAAEAPALASMYAMFNRLTKGEGPGGWERLTTGTPRRRSRPNPAQLAMLMALAAIVALCVTLSTQLRPPADGGCPPAGNVVAAAQFPVQTGSCASYATNK